MIDSRKNRRKYRNRTVRHSRTSEVNEEVIQELHRDPKVYMVFRILRVLVVVCMVREFFRQSYENVLLCILTLLLLVVPSLMQVTMKVRVPRTLEIILLLFIYAAEILGEVNSYYTAIPMWDTILHTLNGFLAAAIGFSLVLILNRDNRIIFELSPLYICIVAFCFSMTIGVIWEIFEFTMDMLFGLDMQKDTIVHTISSITLNPNGEQIPVAIRGITSTAVNGQDLGINGYLDIGIIDTMEDLIVNFIGAMTFSVIGYLALKGRRRQFEVVRRFIVTPESSIQKSPADNSKAEFYPIGNSQPEIPPVENPLAENFPAGNSPADNSSAGNSPAENSSAGNSSLGNSPSEDVSPSTDKPVGTE